jgi:hypothetical protein
MRLDILIGRISTLEGAEKGKGIASGSIYAVVAIVVATLALIKTFL